MINGAGRSRPRSSTILVIQTKFSRAPRWSRRDPASVLSFHAVSRHYRKVARRLRAGTAAVAAAPPPTNQVVVYVDPTAPRAGGGLVREPDHRRQLPRDPRPRREERHRHPPTVPPADRHPARISRSSRRGEPGRCRDRLPVGATARRVDLRHRRSSRRSSSARRCSMPLPPNEFSLKVRLLKEPGVVVTDVPVIRPRRGNGTLPNGPSAACSYRAPTPPRCGP